MDSSKIRNNLLNIVRKDLIIFNKTGSNRKTEKYRQIFSKEILTKKFYEDLNLIKKQISKKFEEFSKTLAKIEDHHIE